jgi:hypothetical protein
MIYYAREDLLHGASGWNLFVSAREPGFATLSPNVQHQRYLLYWLYYYFNRHIGSEVLAMDGLAPWYSPTPNRKDLLPGPLTPALVTMASDRNSIYMVIANGAWDKSIPCMAHIRNFKIGDAQGIVLTQSDRNASPLLASEDDAIHDYPVQFAGSELTCTVPPHSVVFITLKR